MSITVDPMVLDTAYRYLEALDTPVSLSVAIQMRYGEWDDIVSRRVNPRSYCEQDYWKFARDYMACELFRKYPGLPLGVNRREVAISLFWASESQCAKTNVRLDPYIDDPLSEACDVRVSEFIRGVKRRIKWVLGPLPSTLEPRFGPGAVFESRDGSVPPSFLCLGDKMQTLTCTPSMSGLTQFIYETAWGRALVREFADRSAPQYVRGNRFTTVPKDAQKDRGICIEPGANVALQLSVGKHIRERLLRTAGIDLTRGQEIHGRVASFASHDGKKATIDLSNASDTVSRKLVKLLLPKEWFSLLSCLRSPTTEIDGKTVYLEKFSSMGNGFTFELETLIFWAIAQEIDEERVLVYGDDIIVSSAACPAVLSALRFFGFTPNSRKTFMDGLFRESCGTDSFNGCSVLAFRWDSVPEKPSDWMSVHNGIRRALRSIGERGLRVLLPIQNRVPLQVRACKGPPDLGDLVFHEDEPYWNFRIVNSIRWFPCWQPVPSRVSFDHFKPGIQLAMLLYGADSGGVPVRNVQGYRRGRVAFS